MAHEKVTVLKNVYVYHDHFGRIYIDRCKTIRDHLGALPDPGQERRRCQLDIADAFPEGVVDGKKGTIKITIEYEEES